MAADKISLAAKKPELICAFEARYIKIYREKYFINVALRKMHELAKILIAVRKLEPSLKTLSDILIPKYFDHIAHVIFASQHLQ